MSAPARGPFDLRLLRASRSVRRHLLLTAGAGLATACCAIAMAVVLAMIVVSAARSGTSASGGRVGAALFWSFAGLVTARSAVVWLYARQKHRAAPRAVAELQTMLLLALAQAGQRATAADQSSAEVLLTREIDGIRGYLTGYLPALVTTAVVTPATIMAIACVDPVSAAVVAGGVPLIVVFMALVGWHSKDRSLHRLATMTRLWGELVDLIVGLPTLRALGREFAPLGRVRELGRAHYRASMAALRTAFLSGLVLELFATLCVALVAVGVGLRLVFGEMSLFPGLVALLLAPEAYLPIRALGAQFHAAQDGLTACEKTFELLSRHPAPERGSVVGDAGLPLVLEDVTVLGPGGPAPDRLSAVLRPGELTVLTGPNGAGKSTTLHALLGLLTPDCGRVSLGETAVAELDPQWWFSQVRWLPQQPAPSQEPGGLSLGEAQRAALRRVLSTPSPVLLLDEPTAHLDAQAETAVVHELVGLARAGTTVVVVSHRPALIAAADQVVRVEARVLERAHG